MFVYRLYCICSFNAQNKRSYQMNTKIKILVSEESLFNGLDSDELERYDTAASHTKFCAVLRDTLLNDDITNGIPSAQIIVEKACVDVFADRIETVRFTGMQE